MTRDPELRRTPTGKAVASFTLAVDRDYAEKGAERQTDFIECVAWGGTAEFIERNFQKGQLAAATGRLQIRGWTDKDGNKRKTAEIVVSNIYFAGAKMSEKPSDSAEVQYAPPVDNFAEITDDEVLPF
jgi:single-strand DNA-binding protein